MGLRKEDFNADVRRQIDGQQVQPATPRRPVKGSWRCECGKKGTLESSFCVGEDQVKRCLDCAAARRGPGEEKGQGLGEGINDDYDIGEHYCDQCGNATDDVVACDKCGLLGCDACMTFLPDDVATHLCAACLPRTARMPAHSPQPTAPSPEGQA